MKALLPKLILLVLASLPSTPAQAIIGTWNTNPANGDWNLGSNWLSMAAPNGAGDSANFGVSSITSVFLSSNTDLDRIVFNSSASAYTITASPTRTLTISGAGIVNDSGITQSLVAAGTDSSGLFGSITFTQNAMVGSSTNLVSTGSAVANRDGGVVDFLDSSGAGTGSFTASGGTARAGNGGRIKFHDSSSADHASLAVNAGAVSGGHWATMDFYDNSTAAQATITNKGGVFGGSGILDLGGQLGFHNNAMAAQATIINNGGNAAGAFGGLTQFHDNSSAGAAMVINNGGAVGQSDEGATYFYESASAANSVIVNNGGMVPGSSGGATGFLRGSTAGAATLIANSGPGSNSLSGGRIEFEEDSTGGTARVEVFGNGFLNIRQHNAGAVAIGSLKGTGLVYLGNNNLSVGSNNLSTEFSGIIQYGGPFGPDPTGGDITKIGSGTLILSGSNTYTGKTAVNDGNLIVNGSVLTPVVVNGGTLGGTGTVRATNINGGATLSPGDGVGILHVVGDLTLSLGATYAVKLNGLNVGTQYNQTSVIGEVALRDATFSLSLNFQTELGMMFNILDNDATDAINGIFSNLPEGATLEVGGQSFRVSYQGGDGNDVVLTAVVPEPQTWLFLSMGIAVLLLSPRALLSISWSRIRAPQSSYRARPRSPLS